MPASTSRSRPTVAPKIVTVSVGSTRGLGRAAVPKWMTASACSVSISPIDATTFASAGASRSQRKMPRYTTTPNSRAVHERDRRSAGASPGRGSASGTRCGSDDDGQHELTGRAQLGEAVRAEHRHGALREVHDARCLVLADHADGEQRDDRSAAEAEQREEEDRSSSSLRVSRG